MPEQALYQPGTRWKWHLGAATVAPGRVLFRAWAPNVSKMQVKVLPEAGGSRVYEMERDEKGYHSVAAEPVFPGDRYYYVLDGKQERPDPLSRFQPDGVHGPSQVVNPEAFAWTDLNWKGIPHADLILYEAHVGAFTPQGTFQAAVEKLPYLKELGVTCLEIMPVAQFPGRRNWGYDGTYLFAVQNSYGGPEDFKHLVNEAHRLGIAVALDVVYNHLGPEGNYFSEFAPLFSSKYLTPWGSGLNFDGPQSDAVRDIFIGNALYWICEYHIDVLRMDATDWILDTSPRHLLAELAERVRREAQNLGRNVSLIVENDGNNTQLVRSAQQCGYGMDAQWSDDFHHSLHAVLTREKHGYYQDFGSLASLAKAIESTFVYQGQYSPYRKRRHGTDASKIPGEKFVICAQNHDQIGNRAAGDRLASALSFEEQKISAVLLMLSPYLPLLFMGQEYGEKNPFQYFVDHGDAGLIAAVREGRKKEFPHLQGNQIPDPEAESTFDHSKLDWSRLTEARHSQILKLYRDLIELKRSEFSLNAAHKNICKTAFDENEKWLKIEYRQDGNRSLAVLVSFSSQPQNVPLSPQASLTPLLDTEDPAYGGSKKQIRQNAAYFPLAPKSAVALRMEGPLS